MAHLQGATATSEAIAAFSALHALNIYARDFSKEPTTRVKDGESVAQIVQHASDIVFTLQTKHRVAEPDEEWELDLLVAIRYQSGCVLYENHNSHTFSPIDDTKQCRCIGIGRRIGTYLVEWLFDPSLTTARATTIAAHVLTQSIAGDPLCGGERHILVIPSGLDQEPVELDQPAVTVLAEQLSRIEQAVRDVLVYAPGSNLNEETLELRFKALEDAVHAARSVTIRLSGVAAIGIVGHATFAVTRPSGTSEDG